MKQVIVIGGGAAGMLAAIGASTGEQEVHLYEKNEKLGKKLFITGKGRCNLTNASDPDTFFKNVVTNRRFLYSAFYRFTNEQIVDLLEENGVPMKVERGNRVFPASDKSSDVIAALSRECRKRGVKIHLNAEVTQILTEEESLEKNTSKKRVAGVCLKDGSRARADAVVAATGGVSYKSTGSTGDGIAFAKRLGISTTPLRPALVPLVSEDDVCPGLMGLSLKNVGIKITAEAENKPVYEDFGEMIFTHFGVSGPVILSASSYLKDISREKRFILEIDLKPALDDAALDRRLLREIEASGKKQVNHMLGELLPKKMIPIISERAEISETQRTCDLTKVQRQSLKRELKHFRILLCGTRGFDEAIITQGGVDVSEINAHTMESKKVRGLYFAGEVLDVDALTGGYNLQIAWSTGYLAGSSI